MTDNFAAIAWIRNVLRVPLPLSDEFIAYVMTNDVPGSLSPGSSQDSSQDNLSVLLQFFDLVITTNECDCWQVLIADHRSLQDRLQEAVANEPGCVNWKQLLVTKLLREYSALPTCRNIRSFFLFLMENGMTPNRDEFEAMLGFQAEVDDPQSGGNAPPSQGVPNKHLLPRETWYTHRCGMCKEDLKDGQEVVKLPCGHYFHSRGGDCLGEGKSEAGTVFQWFEGHKTCPVCNGDVVVEQPAPAEPPAANLPPAPVIDLSEMSDGNDEPPSPRPSCQSGTNDRPHANNFIDLTEE